jgi:tRNA splicing endonuclease
LEKYNRHKNYFDINTYDPKNEETLFHPYFLYTYENGHVWSQARDERSAFLRPKRILTRGVDYGMRYDKAGILYYPEFDVFKPGFIHSFDILTFDPDCDTLPIWHESGYYVEDGEVWKVELKQGIVIDSILHRGIHYGLKRNESGDLYAPLYRDERIPEWLQAFNENLIRGRLNNRLFNIWTFKPETDPLVKLSWVSFFVEDRDVYYRPHDRHYSSIKLERGLDYGLEKDENGNPLGVPDYYPHPRWQWEFPGALVSKYLGGPIPFFKDIDLKDFDPATSVHPNLCDHGYCVIDGVLYGCDYNLKKGKYTNARNWDQCDGRIMRC